MRNLIIVLAICSGLSPIVAQPVWPGDVNNNGIVNAVDLLYYGQAFGSMGPPRQEISTEWQAESPPVLWPQSFPNGLNFAYADCDGSGMVDNDDFDEAIDENFDKMHGIQESDGFVNGVVGSAPQIHLTPSATLVEAGAEIDISLSLGDQDFPIPSFYGVAILLSYDAELLHDDSFEFEFENSNWITSPKKEFFKQPDDAPGKAQISITRLNQQSQGPGFGEVGKFSIVIEDIIVGLEADTFQLWIDSILLVDASLNAYPMASDTATIIIAKDTTLVSNSERPAAAGINLFPNPASDMFYIQCQAPLKELQLFDALGRAFLIDTQNLDEHSYRINAHEVPSGLYWLVGRTTDGSFRKKIVIL
ncbi:MAG: T9SS type A sorting domain-containing protein [Phaeodactylibacter sp.]|nr:T9SS type A sorting domain-containing protein [Phaeodactylibacter sp.]